MTIMDAKPRVELDSDTHNWAYYVASQRNLYEGIHGHGVKNPNIQDQDDKSFHTHLVGAMAEAALCLYYGLDPRENMTWEQGGKGGRTHDLVVRNQKIEVKATERRGSSRLVVSKGRLKESDAYFLVEVRVSERLCVLRGWARWQDVLERDEPEWMKPTALRSKKLYTVNESNLRRVR